MPIMHFLASQCFRALRGVEGREIERTGGSENAVQAWRSAMIATFVRIRIIDFDGFTVLLRGTLFTATERRRYI